jgi:hypothetical protein
LQAKNIPPRAAASDGTAGKKAIARKKPVGKSLDFGIFAVGGRNYRIHKTPFNQLIYLKYMTEEGRL